MWSQIYVAQRQKFQAPANLLPLEITWRVFLDKLQHAREMELAFRNFFYLNTSSHST